MRVCITRGECRHACPAISPKMVLGRPVSGRRGVVLATAHASLVNAERLGRLPSHMPVSDPSCPIADVRAAGFASAALTWPLKSHVAHGTGCTRRWSAIEELNRPSTYLA